MLPLHEPVAALSPRWQSSYAPAASNLRLETRVPMMTVTVHPVPVTSVHHTSNGNTPRTTDVRPAASHRVIAVLSLSVTEPGGDGLDASSPCLTPFPVQQPGRPMICVSSAMLSAARYQLI